ncbi:YdcF family protein [bacterium]|nr:YdcF family protein [bacterium]
MISSYDIRHMLGELLNPFMLGFLCLVGLLLYLIIYVKQRGLRVAASVILIGLVVGTTGLVPIMIVRYLECQYPVVKTADPDVHWVVVFSGGMLGNIDAPANHLLAAVTTRRLVEGVRLYRQLPKATLLLSGGKELDFSMSAAERMALLASWFAIPKQDVVMERTSINTSDEAISIGQWVGTAPFYLVTSAIHMPRAMAICRKQGLHPIAAPADYPYIENNWKSYIMPNPINLVYLKSTWHELMGRVWQKWVGQA